MIKPIIIDSDIEFVIIGPIHEHDGILIRSSNLSVDLLGSASTVYLQGGGEVREEANNTNYGWVFSEKKPIGINNRKVKLLFCFKADNNFYKTTGKENIIFFEIKEEFDKFLVNAIDLVKRLTLNKEPWVNYDYEGTRSAINWQMSILLYKVLELNKSLIEETSILALDIRNHDQKDEFQKFTKTYFEKVISVLEKGQHYIYVLDYMAHHKPKKIYMDDNQSEVVDLSEQYKRYYQTIEKVVKQRNLEYIRILQLPINPNNEKLKNREKENIEKALSVIFPETYQHIINMKGYADFSLYILEKAIRPYCMAIIDDKYLICEYDRYNKKGEAFPDVLFINIANNSVHNSDLNQFIIKQKGQIERMLDLTDTSFNVNRDNLKKPVDLNTFIEVYNERLNLVEKKERVLINYTKNIERIKSADLSVKIKYVEGYLKKKIDNPELVEMLDLLISILKEEQNNNKDITDILINIISEAKKNATLDRMQLLELTQNSN